MSNLVLGIESSCDDTAAAVVDRSGKVLSSVIASQILIHSSWGGVYPEFASRAHVENIVPTILQAMRAANVTPSDLDAICVTRGPGLVGPLLVGLNTASGLGMGWRLPVVGVNHLRGHVRSADLEESRVRFPAVVLLVSGGHTLLAHMVNRTDIRLLASTRDDSLGEAYDKVGRMLGLSYPAGAAIDRLAAVGSPVVDFPRPLLNEGLEFSFSGLKSAVARHLVCSQRATDSDVAASFVQACLDVVAAKCTRAISLVCPESLVVVGGVAASPQLRARVKVICDAAGISLCLPPLRWSTDNAAMIALTGFDYLDAGAFIDPVVTPRLSLESL